MFQILVDMGLVGSIEEANAVVIPPFSKRGLLPSEPGKVNFKSEKDVDQVQRSGRSEGDIGQVGSHRSGSTSEQGGSESPGGGLEQEP